MGDSNLNLLSNPEKIRNICIMAHVDHGKTTLADALITTNGIITQRQAGKIRYMDSRKDEMERGITMKSSCVTLTYQREDGIYVVNLIDSPGHVDFSSEVSTAVRLCDGAIVVVDVVDGVCAQTKVVLRQAWMENIHPVLFLNKIDRLFVELKMLPLEAYFHLMKVLEQVNAFLGELYNTDVLERISSETTGEVLEGGGGWMKNDRRGLDTQGKKEEEEEEKIYFSPERGNVVFGSAFDGWGFRLNCFSTKYYSKLGLESESSLRGGLWGDFYIGGPKGSQKKVLSGAREKGKSPLFVSLILDNIQKLYQTALVEKDKVALDRICQALSVSLPMSVQRSADFRLKHNVIMQAWLPLATAVLESCIHHIPGANGVGKRRARRLLCSASRRFESLPVESRALADEFMRCDAKSTEVIVYVSKMFSVDKDCFSKSSHQFKVGGGGGGVVSIEEIQQRRINLQNKIKEQQRKANEGDMISVLQQETPEEEEEEEELIAFARVFSGTLKAGQKLYVLGPKHDPSALLRRLGGEDVAAGLNAETENADKVTSASEHVHVEQIADIYLLLGRELERVRYAPAGSVIGVGGLRGIAKSATLSSTPLCPPFTELTMAVTAILRVAVEPENPRDLNKLRRGLAVLNRADPCVQIEFEKSGEYVLVTAGEVHLQRCLEDLRERYARGVVLSVSAPIVPFRETVVPTPTTDRLNEAIDTNKKKLSDGKKDGICEVSTGVSGRQSLRVRAVPLPEKVTDFLQRSETEMALVCRGVFGPQLTTVSDIDQETNELEGFKNLSAEASVATIAFKKKLENIFNDCGPQWENYFERILSFGPNFKGCNILFNQSCSSDSLWKRWEQEENEDNFNLATPLVTGFQLATAAGPLCEEPLWGVGFIVEELIWGSEDEEGGTGRLISSTRDAMRRAIEASHARLMTAMYSLTVSVCEEAVGRLYELIGKRKGRVLQADVTEGSTNWTVEATLPVVQSFQFANELRTATSGEASPQLFFSHWEVVDEDPFWTPRTAEEMAHWGAQGDAENQAMIYIDQVRSRKGLLTQRKIVQAAEKQRNLSKNK